jgi:transcriptional regulator with XRE-family HTH domain
VVTPACSSPDLCCDTIYGMDTISGMESFGELLRRLRAGRLSQEALALRAATSQSYVSRVEAGEVLPTLDQAKHLLHCLGYELRLNVEPLHRRSDRGSLIDQLAMSPEERMQSAAALHNVMAEMRAGLSG